MRAESIYYLFIEIDISFWAENFNRKIEKKEKNKKTIYELNRRSTKLSKATVIGWMETETTHIQIKIKSDRRVKYIVMS